MAAWPFKIKIKNSFYGGGVQIRDATDCTVYSIT